MARVLSFVFFGITLYACGQQEHLKGRIYADSLQGFAINIVNFTQKIGTTNDDQGFFEIPAREGDSIIFSSVQYQIRSIIVTGKQLQEESLTIALLPVLQQLEQVNVSNIQLSGNLDKDAAGIALLPYVDNQILGLPFSDRPQPTLIQRRIYTARSGVLDLPINYLNGTLKKLKHIKALEDLKQIIQKGETMFSTAFYVDVLGIPKELISDFVYYCAEEDNFESLLENSKQLRLLEFFQQNARLYKEHKKID